MDKGYNFFYFEAEFRKYLVALNVENSTVKGYLSDLRFFFSWLESRIQSTTISYSDMPQVFSHGLVADYYEFTHREGVNEKTALRRVATVRKFFVFCVKQQWLTHNPVTSHESLEEKQEKMSLINTYLSSLKQTNKSRDLDYQNKLISEFLNY